MCDIKQVLHREDSGKEISLVMGQGFAIVLDDMGGAGYRWSFDLGPNSPLTAGESTSTPYAAPGGGSSRHMIFCAHKPGATQLQLKLQRSWEKNAVPIQDFQLKINVTP